MLRGLGSMQAGALGGALMLRAAVQSLRLRAFSHVLRAECVLVGTSAGGKLTAHCDEYDSMQSGQLLVPGSRCR